MATVHYLTNRGKLKLLQGDWDDSGGTAIRMGLIKGTARPAAIDTEAEIQDFNFVDDLLNATGVDEPTASGYARSNLTRTNWAEDDTNNYANAVAADVVLSAVANNGESVIGGFYYEFVTNDADSHLLSVWLLDAPGVPFNGSDITIDHADVYRGV